MIITPVLHRGTCSDLVSIDESIRMCLDTVKEFWYVPNNATRFWFELVVKPEENSVEIELRRWEHCVVWRKKGGHRAQDFYESEGLCGLLRDVLPLGDWRLVNVVLWYK